VRRALPYVALVAVVVGLANFGWFLVESQALGGDGLNGFVRSGRYFLDNKGTYTEVSQATWEWSRVHAMSIFVTHPLALVGMAYLLIGFIFPSMISPRSAAALGTLRVQNVRDSGAVVASGRMAGRIGGLRLSGPLIEVAVYPSGVVVKPFLMAAKAVLRSEIRELKTLRGPFRRGLEMYHDGIEVASPLVLLRRPGDEVLQAIAGLGVAPPMAQGEPALGSMPPRTSAATSPAVRGTGWRYGLPPRDAAPRGIIATLEIFGLIFGAGMVAVGIFWAIPKLGPFGWAWTLGITAITVFNTVRVLKSR
jgi:hypothetical protein